ncbi:hypothetical protein D9M71_779450 [compost metagenome]
MALDFSTLAILLFRLGSTLLRPVIDRMSSIFVEYFRQKGVGPLVCVVLELSVVLGLRGHFFKHFLVQAAESIRAFTGLVAPDAQLLQRFASKGQSTLKSFPLDCLYAHLS